MASAQRVTFIRSPLRCTQDKRCLHDVLEILERHVTQGSQLKEQAVIFRLLIVNSAKTFDLLGVFCDMYDVSVYCLQMCFTEAKAADVQSSLQLKA